MFPMGDIEGIGLLKMDLLGLRNLTVITDALNLIEQETGEKVDLDKIPLTDPETFGIFQQGTTDGVSSLKATE